MKVLFLFALVLNLSLLGIQVGASQCTNDNGILQNSYCNCYAGYAPDYTQGADNCLNSISCTTGNADDSLISGYYAPTLLDSNTPVKFDHDRVIISFVQPATQMPWHRRETYISFYAGASSTGTAGDLSCQYPGSLWTKVLQPSPSCKDLYTFSMPFNRAASCGFQKAVTPSTITYTTTVKFSYIEVSDASSTNSRSLSNLFTINIQLVRQTAITAALNLNLASTSDATVDAFVIGTSAYDLLSAQTRVLFQTHTSWPYQIGSALTEPAVLDGPTVTIHPVGTNAEISPDYLTPDNCPQVAGASCVQQFEIVVSRADPALCDFQGTYVVDTQLVCVDTDSCTPATGPQITITLDSKNICTPPVVDTGVSTTQSLLSFNDAGLSNTQTDFETGDTSYWTFTIVDPNVSIDSVILNTVVLSLVDNPEQLDPDYIIKDKVETITGVIVEPHNAVNVVHPPGTPVVVSFGLVLNRGKLPNTVQTLGLGDSIKSINLAVIVDVQYHGNKKRTIQAVVSPANNGGAASTAAFVVRSKEYSQAIGKQSNKGSDCTGLCSFAKGVMGALGF